MNKFILALIISTPFFLTGCYTVLVSDVHTQDFTVEERTAETNYYYYEDGYYGDYYYFYNTPWWAYYGSGGVVADPAKREENNRGTQEMLIRREGTGRAAPEGRGVTVPSATRSQEGSSSGNKNSVKQGDEPKPKKVEKSSDNNSSQNNNSNTNTQSRQGSNSSGSNNTRNDGGRATDPKRR